MNRFNNVQFISRRKYFGVNVQSLKGRGKGHLLKFQMFSRKTFKVFYTSITFTTVPAIYLFRWCRTIKDGTSKIL